jgi:methylmalonyl-CoA carboxyltransferase small subunit
VKLKITIDQKTYEVDVEAAEPETAPGPVRGYVAEPAPVRLSAAAAPPPAQPEAVANEEKVCRSPIAGIVVRVAAQPGQRIQPGDILIVLEAMKMETNITAPLAGKLKDIKVKHGDSVQSGQVVAEFV